MATPLSVTPFVCLPVSLDSHYESPAPEVSSLLRLLLVLIWKGIDLTKFVYSQADLSPEDLSTYHSFHTSPSQYSLASVDPPPQLVRGSKKLMTQCFVYAGNTSICHLGITVTVRFTSKYTTGLLLLMIREEAQIMEHLYYVYALLIHV